MNGFRIGKSKMTRRKFVCFHIVVFDCVYQLIITAYREKIDTKTFFPFDIGAGVGVLVQISHHGEESRFIPMKTTP